MEKRRVMVQDELGGASGSTARRGDVFQELDRRTMLDARALRRPRRTTDALSVIQEAEMIDSRSTTVIAMILAAVSSRLGGFALFEMRFFTLRMPARALK